MSVERDLPLLTLAQTRKIAANIMAGADQLESLAGPGAMVEAEGDAA
jgi:hypothetical protein